MNALARAARCVAAFAACGAIATSVAAQRSAMRLAGEGSSGPQIVLRGSAAIVRWTSTAGSELRVEYGATSALGAEVVGRGAAVIAGSPLPGRAALPNAARRVVRPAVGESDQALYEAVIDGLVTGSEYFYRATLRQGGAVVEQTPVLRLTMPLIAVRIRPHRLDVVQDGDRDVGGRNKGEMHFSWQHSLDPFGHRWAEMDIIGGCYPAGGTWTVGVPETFRIPAYDVTQNAPGHNPPADPLDPPQSDPNNPTTPDPNQPTNPSNQLPPSSTPQYPPNSVKGCVRERSNPWVTVKANTVKVKSGQVIELRATPEEWVVQSPPVVLVRTATPARSSSTDRLTVASVAATPSPRSRPVNRDGGGASAPAGPSPTGPPPSPQCEARQPRQAFLPVYVTVEAFEIDEIPDPRTGVPDHRVNKQTAHGWDVVCFDLREAARSIMVGTTGKGDGVKFVGWFQVDLIYR